MDESLWLTELGDCLRSYFRFRQGQIPWEGIQWCSEIATYRLNLVPLLTARFGYYAPVRQEEGTAVYRHYVVVTNGKNGIWILTLESIWRLAEGLRRLRKVRLASVKRYWLPDPEDYKELCEAGAPECERYRKELLRLAEDLAGIYEDALELIIGKAEGEGLEIAEILEVARRLYEERGM